MIQLRSHMAPARGLSDQHFLESARAAVMTLDTIGLPAAALGRTGRPIAVNPRFERLMPDAAGGRRRHTQLVNTAADAIFNHAGLAPEEDSNGVRLIPIPAVDGQPPMIMHIISVQGAARDRLPGVLAILVVTPVIPKDVPPAALLQGLFHMTPAEARVAHAVAQCRTIGEIANSLGLSQETVRSQLKAALAKTGVTRKLDLAVMLAGACMPMSSDAS